MAKGAMPKAAQVEDRERMWNQVTCRRVGAPPLRFKGARLSHVELPDDAAPALFLTLWARRTARTEDVVVALSDGTADWKPHAVIAPDIETAIETVERTCAGADRSASSDDVGADVQTGIDLLERHLTAANRMRRFSELAGIALDHWHALAETTSPAASRGTPPRRAKRRGKEKGLP
jgi:hypothetical protein